MSQLATDLGPRGTSGTDTIPDESRDLLIKSLT